LQGTAIKRLHIEGCQIMANKKAKAVAPTNAKIVSELLGGAAAIGYNIGSATAEAAAYVLRCERELNRSEYLDAIVQLKAGRIVAYFENPPKAERTACANYIARRWDNLPREERIASAVEMIGKPAPDTAKPNRRIATEHKAVRAADSAVSNLRRHAGLTKSSPKKNRTPRAGSNVPDGASVTIAAPKFTNDNDAVEYFGNVAAMLVQAVEKNQQPGSPKAVKGIAFRLSSLCEDFKRNVAKVLNSGE
jgi:hypothetical protein